MTTAADGKAPIKWNNVVEMFFDQADRLGNAPFLHSRQGEGWSSISWANAAQTVARLAGALRALGLQPRDRVLLVSENRPEWCLADLAIMAAGGIMVPAYTTNNERDHAHIIENSGATLAIVSTAKLAQPLLPALYQAEGCRALVSIEPLKLGQATLVDLHRWDALIASSATTVEEARGWATFGREALACIIYTSGTGGAPRGVMHHHGALLHNAQAGVEIVYEDFGSAPDVFLSFLPLSHAYEHTMGQMLAIALGAETYYAESLDKLSANISEVRPTIIVVVPRLFEVMRQKIVRAVEKGAWLQRQMFDLTLWLGRRKRSSGLSWAERLLDQLVERLVRSKMRIRFGGRNKALVSGGAPLNPEVGQFFSDLGLTLLQGYGQTEAGPLISVNRPSRGLKMNSVGPPVPHTEVRIADDGEILVRGELVMHGYWRADAETARVLQDGWLHTGDIGHLDTDGHLVITDRKKDIIVNDKGDNVSPQRVEGMLTLEPEILQAMVHGDRRPYLVGLLVPDPDGIPAGLDAQTAVKAAVERVNARLNVIERVRRFALADQPFTLDNEQMTPTLKIRRHVIRRVYGSKLDALYSPA